MLATRPDQKKSGVQQTVIASELTSTGNRSSMKVCVNHTPFGPFTASTVSTIASSAATSALVFSLLSSAPAS